MVLYCGVNSDSIVCSDMEKGFLSLKGRGKCNGVKEKSVLSNDVAAKNKDCVKDSVVPSVTVTYGNTQKDLNDDHVAMEVQSLLVDQTNAVKTGGDHTHHYLHRELLWLETPL
ncbi:hypothetical protein Tco_0559709, partial [Tanacetum coccineum]